MVSEVEALEDLAQQLRERERIGVDGTDGVRKTSISTSLSQTLGLPLLSLDDYLVKKQGGFVEFLRYDELRDELGAAQRFIVEGVCLLEVLERIGAAVDALVYVKRYHHGLWADERELDVTLETVDDFLAQEHKYTVRVAQLFGGSDHQNDDGPSLADEIVRYHAKYRPHQNADCVYRWNDG
jgi:hypothetical protein